MSFTLSKSSFITGLQCHRALWYRLKRPKEVPEPDAATLARFETGHDVGDWAKRVFPGGVEVPWDGGTRKAVKDTLQLLPRRIPIFEATFRYESPHGPTMMRADVLDPVGDDQWDLYEVKATTSAKEVHVQDVAFQRYVLEGCGIRVRRCHVMHLDRAYVRQGPVDPSALFARTRVDEEVARFLPAVEPELARMFSALDAADPPKRGVGPHCTAPYTCALHERCWAFLSKRDVFGLYWGGKAAWRWFGAGIHSRDDIPLDADLKPRQRIQLEAERTGSPHIDVGELDAFLSGLEYPLYYMDFETLATAVPLFAGARPYMQVPFQFSVHIQQEPGGATTHHGFLADIEHGTADPRPEFVARLRACLGERGSIVVYNRGFEQGRLRECTRLLPEYAPWYRHNVEPRIVDLLVPFRTFAYYHPAQNGSASIKAVLPAVAGKSYEDLEIGDGSTAANEFLRTHLGEVPPAEKTRVREALERYCELDTAGMVDIVEALRGLATRTQ